MYSLLIFDLSIDDKKNKIIESEELTIFSPFKTNPQFKLGYHHFIDRTRDALGITKKLDTKNDFYFVVNEFETIIPDYSEHISNLTKIYLNNKDLEFGNDFYKFWEILFVFNLIDKNTKTISTISNDSSDCIDCITYFSEKILGIESSKFEINNVNITQEKEFEYNKEIKNQYLNKISKKENFNSPSKFIKSKKYSDLIIANSENYYSSINNKEHESYKLFLGELLVILSSLNKNGNCVFKVFDTFTFITLKIIYILSSLFEEVYINKPLLSRLSDSEKYLICKKYKYDTTDKKINKIIKMLEEIISKIDSNNFLNDILVDYILPDDFINNFKFINTKLVNEQQILINEIVKYIKDNNYFGDKFHDSKNKQIEATKWWVSLFFPPSNNIYQTNKETVQQMLKNTVNKHISEKEKFLSNFI
jgi:23S rRNA U2552 (ribose-2'-O)-methylase RlmE/FtsJ